MTQFQSIEARLQLGLGLSLALLIAAAWWLGHEALHRTAETYVLSRLQHDAEAILGSVDLDPKDGLRLGRSAITPVYNQPYSGHYFVLGVAGGALRRSRSLWDQPLPLQPRQPGESDSWHQSGPLNQDLLVWSGGFRHKGLDLTLMVAEDLTPLHATLRSFERLFALMAIGGLAAIALLQHLVIRRAFARLEPVYKDIDALEQGGTRSLTESVPTEILPLVRKINRLLTVYTQRLERSRNAAGNLAHALKAPLSLMMRQLETQSDTRDPTEPALLLEQVERIQTLLERELKRARLAGEVGPGMHFDPRTEMPVLQRLLERMYPNKTLDLHCRMDQTGVLPADREDMLELIGTLMDNACKWAKTQAQCVIEPAGTGVRIRVEDDGPGCGQAQIDAITNRGVRLDEAVQGHGLGLSIAREIVDLYGGHLDLGRSETLGGFRVEITLPLGIIQTTPA